MGNIDILSIGGFSFFVLIILVGYIFVEVIFGEKYFLSKIIKRYSGSLFDRLVHYIFWGFIINFIFFILIITNQGLFNYFGNFYNSSGELGNALSFIGNPADIQKISFTIGYFIYLSVFLVIIFGFKKLFYMAFNSEIKGKELSFFEWRRKGNSFFKWK